MGRPVWDFLLFFVWDDGSIYFRRSCAPKICTSSYKMYVVLMRFWHKLTPQFLIIFPGTRFNDDPLSRPGLWDMSCPKVLMSSIVAGTWKCHDVSKRPSLFISKGPTQSKSRYTASHPRRPLGCFVVVMGVQTDGQNGFNRRSAGTPTHLKTRLSAK